MQCYGCKHYVKPTTEYGCNQPAECRRMEVVAKTIDGDTDALVLILETMAFRLSELNNCPFYEDSAPRRSILDLRKMVSVQVAEPDAQNGITVVYANRPD